MTSRRSKRARLEDDVNGGAKKRAHGDRKKATNGAEHHASSMPQSVFPLGVWEFLLEPPIIDDAISTESLTPLLDFKSIQSFMLVSKATKESFDDCNGWSLCLAGLQREAAIKEAHMECFKNKCKPFEGVESMTDEEFARCQNLLSKIHFMQSVLNRWVALQIDLIPAAARQVRHTKPVLMDDCKLEISSTQTLMESTMSGLEFSFTLEDARRQLILSHAFVARLEATEALSNDDE